MIQPNATMAAVTKYGEWRRRCSRTSVLHHFSRIKRLANDIVLLIDGDGRIMEANDRALEAYGLSRGEIAGLPVARLRSEARDWREDWAKVIADGHGLFETVHRRRDGSDFPVEVSSRSMVIGGRLYVQSIIRDISQRKAMERQITRLKDVYAALSQTNQCIIRVSDQTALFDTICRIAVQYGHFPLAWIGLMESDSKRIVPCAWAGQEVGFLDGLVVVGDAQSAFGQSPAGRAIATGEPQIAADYAVSAQTEPWHARARQFGIRSAAAFPLRRGNAPAGTLNLYSSDPDFFSEEPVALLVEMAMDISYAMDRLDFEAEHRQAVDQLAFLAHHDPLTRLPNRLQGKHRMEWTMAQARRNAHKAALLFLDLDHFKRINDSLGHAVGDDLLIAVAERLKACVRAADTISRQSGDEFLIGVGDLPTADDAARAAWKILEAFASPFSLDGFELSVSASIGIAVYPDDGEDFDLLLKHADTAMYSAKEAGRDIYRFFIPQMNAEANEYLNIRNDLQKALERGELILHYQPQIDLASGRIVGAEALIRWNHPKRGLIAPGRFIPIAEDSGLIVPIGDWVLREACRQAAAWQRAGLHRTVMAVNLSAVQFKRGDLHDSVVRALDEASLEPSCLELELTESILIKDKVNVLQTVERLKDCGVKLSIDDFGTGYSSLAYLKQFHVDKLKIDRSFVSHITSDPNDEAIVRAIIQMAHTLGLTTLAEGVEDADMAASLRQHGCDEVQGFYFGRPMPADDVAGVLAQARYGRA